MGRLLTFLVGLKCVIPLGSSVAQVAVYMVAVRHLEHTRGFYEKAYLSVGGLLAWSSQCIGMWGEWRRGRLER